MSISATTGVSAASVNADQAAAIIRTAVTKSGSCKTMKANATSDSRLVDSVRGKKFALKSILMVDGSVSVDNNGTTKQRVDRVKLLGQAVVNIMRSGAPVNRNTLIVEMDRLYSVYKSNVDMKQPTAEQFDDMIGEQFGAEAIDSYKKEIRDVPKAGDFSVSDLTITLIGSSCGVGDNNPILFSGVGVSSEMWEQVQGMMGVRRPVSPSVAGGETKLAPAPKKSGTKRSKA